MGAATSNSEEEDVSKLIAMLEEIQLNLNCINKKYTIYHVKTDLKRMY